MHVSTRARIDTGARSARRLLAATIAAGALATAPPARADLVAKINAMRKGECAAPAAAATLRSDKTLDDLAHDLARGETLADAIKSVDYPAASAQSLHVKGATSEDAVRGELAKHHCKEVGDGRYAEAGVFHTRDDYWIVLAIRKVEPPPLDPVAAARRVLELVNAARAAGRDCGEGHRFAPAEPVVASPLLANVALLHSRDMAEQRTLGHPGSDGSTPAERVTHAGYEWRGTGENVASGQQTADAVVAAWLTSPGHCLNIMEPRFTEMGVGFALAPGQNPNIYWTQVFATPR
jgi:uncharacterized protein YkwD